MQENIFGDREREKESEREERREREREEERKSNHIERMNAKCENVIIINNLLYIYI